MSVGGPIFLLAAIWGTIHGLYHFINRRAASSLLPTSTGNTRPRSLLGNAHHNQIHLKALHLRVSTTRWNTVHDQLAASLVKKRGKRIGSVLRATYNVGSVLGAVGMLAAILVLCWLCSTSVWRTFEKYPSASSPHHQEAKVVRRMASEDIPETPRYPTSTFPAISPIIPGITVPLSHLPIIILAVFLSQVLHELGHAVAAALESLPLLSSGASFTVCIPAAFVTFPIAATNNLSPQARSRVIAAGPFHNLAFWCILVLITHLGVVNLASLVSGYRNIVAIGKVVVDVDVGSPLYLHLLPGSILTKLDDTPLSSTSEDVWTKYLTGLPRKPLALGWCVGTTTFHKSESCCQPSSSTKESPLACFTEIDQPSVEGCVNPVPVLTNPVDSARCRSARECGPDTTCVIPRHKTELMRMKVRPPNAEEEDETVVLWNGSPEEVYEEVRVSNWMPRVSLLPLWAPLVIQQFWEYLMMATLSLYFFNLLPLPYLDGTELLAAFLDLTFQSKNDGYIYDVESLEGGAEVEESSRVRKRWKEMILKFVHYAVAGILMLYILLAVMNVGH